MYCVARAVYGGSETHMAALAGPLAVGGVSINP